MARRKKKSEVATEEPVVPEKKTGPKLWMLEILGTEKLVTVTPLGDHQYAIHDSTNGNFIATCGTAWFEQNAVDPDR